jgi:hypothetical protein
MVGRLSAPAVGMENQALELKAVGAADERLARAVQRDASEKPVGVTSALSSDTEGCFADDGQHRPRIAPA